MISDQLGDIEGSIHLRVLSQFWASVSFLALLETWTPRYWGLLSVSGIYGLKKRKPVLKFDLSILAGIAHAQVHRDSGNDYYRVTVSKAVASTLFSSQSSAVV